MKRKIFAITATVLFTMIAFIACKKEGFNNKNDKQSNYSSISRLAVQDNLLDNFYLAKGLHNGLLELEFTNLSNGSLTVGDTVGLISMSNLYFTSEGNFSNDEIDNLNSGISNLLSSTSDLQDALENYINSDESMSSLYSWIIAQSEDWTLPYTNFEQRLINKLSQIEEDELISNEDKIAYSFVLGVSAGTYQYWQQNIDNWRQLISPNSDPIVYRNKWVEFFLRDCAGATWGAMYGTSVPLLGTGAGAIGGAAILSAMEAQSWK